MEYTVSQARTHLSRLIREAEAGEEVIILRNGRPAFKVIPFRASEDANLGSFEIGSQGEDGGGFPEPSTLQS